MDDIYLNKTDIIKLYKYLCNIENETFIFYDYDMNVIQLKNILCVLSNHKKLNIHEHIIKVKSGIIENILIEYYNRNSKSYNIGKIYNLINCFYENKIDITRYINLEHINDKTRCLICLSQLELKKILITKCKHFFCLECILENFNYNHSCPLCRSSLTVNKLYHNDNFVLSN